MNNTISYYEKNADLFTMDTVDLNFCEVSDRFLKYIPVNGKILDFGCGAGRDSKYFHSRGFQVEATDGSYKLCCYVRERLGIPVRHMLFEELEEQNRYDGIWACASILHVPKRELPDIIRRMSKALQPCGVIYLSFKYGEFEGDRNGRFFSDYTEKSFDELINRFSELQILEEWMSSDVRPGRSEEKWLNIILRKQV